MKFNLPTRERCQEIVNKTGDEFISSINSPFEYEINYNVTINDYIGEATTTIVDSLPYEIDETKSNLDGGIYNKENNTITLIRNYEKRLAHVKIEKMNVFIDQSIFEIFINDGEKVLSGRVFPNKNQYSIRSQNPIKIKLW